MATSDSWSDLVDFVEEHGGSLSGEQRYELVCLAKHYCDALNANKLSNWEAGNG
jgi:hypothetical protein